MTVAYFTDDSEYLEHYGVKGMKWGVRRDRRMAKKDAKKVAKARVDYGVGSETRRKLLAKQVEQRSKVSKTYKDTYEQTLKNLPHEKYAQKAQNRHMKDLKAARGDKSVRRLVAAGAAFGGYALGSVGAATLQTINGKTIRMRNGNTFRIDMNQGQMRTATALLQYGGLGVGATVGSIPYKRTADARRRLNYKY